MPKWWVKGVSRIVWEECRRWIQTKRSGSCSLTPLWAIWKSPFQMEFYNSLVNNGPGMAIWWWRSANQAPGYRTDWAFVCVRKSVTHLTHFLLGASWTGHRLGPVTGNTDYRQRRSRPVNTKSHISNGTWCSCPGAFARTSYSRHVLERCLKCILLWVE